MAELVNRDRALGVDLEIARIENILLMRKVLLVRFTVKFLTVFFKHCPCNRKQPCLGTLNTTHVITNELC